MPEQFKGETSRRLIKKEEKDSKFRSRNKQSLELARDIFSRDTHKETGSWHTSKGL